MNDWKHANDNQEIELIQQLKYGKLFIDIVRQ